MKKYIIFLLVIAFLPVVNPSFAQIDRSKRPEAGPAPVINFGEPVSFQLENGLKVFVVENNKLPVVSFSFIAKDGTILEGDKAGSGQIAGQLMRSATKTKSKDVIDEEVDFMGAQLSTYFLGVYASSLKRHTEKLMDLTADILMNYEFKQEELDKIKKQMISGLAYGETDPNAIISKVNKIINFGLDHPYGEPVKKETVEKISLDDCKKIVEKFFTPKNFYLSIVGDITADESKELVQKYFGKWTVNDFVKTEFKVTKPPLVRKVAIVDRPNSVQSVINITYPIEFKISSPEYFSALVMNKILGGDLFSARLFSNLREKHGFTYGAYSALTDDKLVGSFTAGCNTRNSATDSSVTEFFNEMKRIRTEKVSEEELQKTKNFMTGGFSRSLENPETVSNFAVTIDMYNLPQDFYKNYLKNLNAVTVDDILNSAKKFIKPDNSTVLVVGKASEIEEGLKKFSASGKIDFFDNVGNKIDPASLLIPEGLTAETVLENHLKAIGGRERLSQLTDLVTEMTTQVDMGTSKLDINVSIYRKVPNKFLTSVSSSMFAQKTLFDGEKGSMIMNGQTTEITGKELTSLKVEAVFDLYLDIAKNNLTAKLTGVEKVNGKDAYRVVYSHPDCNSWTQFYNTETFYLVKELRSMESEMGAFDSAIEYSDFKEVDGRIFPFKISQNLGNQVLEFTVSSYLVNKGVDESLFK